MRSVSSNEKKEVLKDWGRYFPNLSMYSSSVLLMKLDLALIGLSLIRLPRCEKYRPLLVCYPLWKKDNKENLDEPIFLFEIHGKNDIQFNIPYKTEQRDVVEAFKCTQMQVGVLLNETVYVKDLLKFLKLLFRDALIESSPVAQAKILEYKLFISIYMDDMCMIKSVKSEIERISDTWNPKLFEWKYGKVIDWRMKLFEKIENRDAFMEQISQNMSDVKISKLRSGLILL